MLVGRPVPSSTRQGVNLSASPYWIAREPVSHAADWWASTAQWSEVGALLRQEWVLLLLKEWIWCWHAPAAGTRRPRAAPSPVSCLGN